MARRSIELTDDRRTGCEPPVGTRDLTDTVVPDGERPEIVGSGVGDCVLVGDRAGEAGSRRQVGRHAVGRDGEGDAEPVAGRTAHEMDRPAGAHLGSVRGPCLGGGQGRRRSRLDRPGAGALDRRTGVDATDRARGAADAVMPHVGGPEGLTTGVRDPVGEGHGIPGHQGGSGRSCRTAVGEHVEHEGVGRRGGRVRRFGCNG